MGLYETRLYQKAGPVHDLRARARWAKRHKLCAACGISDFRAVLHTHHIVRFGRSDEECNLSACLNQIEAWQRMLPANAGAIWPGLKGGAA